MQKNEADASDGSVQEIAVNDSKPIVPTQQDTISDSDEIVAEGAEDGSIDEIVTSHSQVVGQQGTQGPVAPAEKNIRAQTLVKIALDRIQAHPKNRLIFGEHSPAQIEALRASIAEVGLLTPLVVTADPKKQGYYTLLSGHTRRAALELLDWDEVTVEVMEVANEDERLLRLLEFNRYRVPTNVQRIRIYGIYFELESKKARDRQAAAGVAMAAKNRKLVKTVAQAGKKGGVGQPNLTDKEAGKARDIAAAKVNLTGVTAEKGRKVVEAADELREEDAKTADELLAKLDEDGFDPAFKYAIALGVIEKSTRSAKDRTGGDGVGTLGETRGGVRSTASAALPLANIQGAQIDASIDSNAIATADAEPEDEREAPMEKSESGGSDQAEVSDDPTAVGRIIFYCHKLVDEYGYVEMPELGFEEKRSLRVALEEVVECYKDCKEELLEASWEDSD